MQQLTRIDFARIDAYLSAAVAEAFLNAQLAQTNVDIYQADETFYLRQLEDAVRRSNAPQTGNAPKAKRGGISTLPYGFAEEQQIEIAFSGKPEQLSLHLRNLTQSEAHRILSLVDQNKGLIFPGK